MDVLTTFTGIKKIFAEFTAICFKDVDGTVHYREETVALNNKTNNGYVYYDGEITLRHRGEGGCIGDYEVRVPLVFVGAFLYGIPEKLFEATVAGLTDNSIWIKRASFDKDYIRTRENIDISKFTDLAMIRVEFDFLKMEFYDPKCEVDICEC